MSDNVTPLKPLKTWSHLAKSRRRPSEYDIVSTNLLWNMSEDTPPEAGAGLDMHEWHRKYRYNSPLTHSDWDAFRDPDSQVYRTYNIVQDGQETYVENLCDEYSRLEHDKGLTPEWLDALEAFYTPGRYPLNICMMNAGYGAGFGRSSTIVNTWVYQAADSMRHLSRVAYRTAELKKNNPSRTFGEKERETWEHSPAWQGIRELMEKSLVTYDVGEHFVAFNLVAKVAFDEAYVAEFARCARIAGDDLAALISDSHMRDVERQRRWSRALVEFCLADNPANADVINGWLDKWVPLAERAVKEVLAILPGADAQAAIDRAAKYRHDLGLAR